MAQHLERRVNDTMADRRPRVLLVDDNVELRSLLLSRLDDLGYDIVDAGDGVDALAQLARRHHDVLITDVIMPRLDGIGLVERVRANPATAQLPVIVMSGWFGGADESEPLPIAADAFIRKPIRTAELTELLARLVARPGGETHQERGILVSTSMQVLQVLEHTGIAQVRSPSGEGIVRVIEGELIAATAGELSGEAAAREILSWSQAEITLREIDDWAGDAMIHVPFADLLAPPGWNGRSAAIPADLAEANRSDRGRDGFAGSARFASPASHRDSAPFQGLNGSGFEERHRSPPAAVAALPAPPSANGTPARTNPGARSESLVDAAIGIPGVIAAVLIDEHGGATIRETDATNGELASHVNAIGRLVVANHTVLAPLGHPAAIESIVVDQTTRTYVFRPLATDHLSVLLVVLDKWRANLALVQRSLDSIVSQMGSGR
jgi:CheY-like chemotaxis protein